MEQNYVTVTLCYPHWFRAQDITVQDSRVHARPFMELRRHISSEVLSQLVYVADLSGRRSSTPRTALTNRLLGPSVKLSTVGGRAFSVAEPTI